jgi:hypothetical protein
VKAALKSRLQAAEAHLAAQRKAQPNPRLKALSDQELESLYDLVRVNPAPADIELAAALNWDLSRTIEFWSGSPAELSDEPSCLS